MSETIDSVVRSLPRGERRCDTCALCQPVDDTYFKCVADYEVPANIIAYKQPPLDSTARWMTRRDVIEWESRRQSDCAFHQPKETQHGR